MSKYHIIVSTCRSVPGATEELPLYWLGYSWLYKCNRCTLACLDNSSAGNGRIKPEWPFHCMITNRVNTTTDRPAYSITDILSNV